MATASVVASDALGLSEREAARRLLVTGPNELAVVTAVTWRRALARQLLHPLALLLWVAAALSLLINLPPLAVAIVVVIALNASLALWQEHQTGRAIELLRTYLPQRAVVRRDGHERSIPAIELVPGDLMVLSEGDRVSADGTVITGAIEVDMSTVTGESVPVERLEHDAVFSGTVVLGGRAHVVITTTGGATELGRIAALTHRQRIPPSPLERQVRRTAWLIAIVAVIAGVAFIPLGTLVAGLSLQDTIVFAIGLLVANVPEGLLPTITLALAMGVRQLAANGTLVRRLSAVETLGSVSVICTDKTGTLTENAMTLTDVWTESPTRLSRAISALADTSNDPTAVAMLDVPSRLGVTVPPPATLLASFRFDPRLRLSSVVRGDGMTAIAAVAGAPESVIARCVAVARGSRDERLDENQRRDVLARVAAWAEQGLRVIALADRAVVGAPLERDEVEVDLVLLGLVGLLDPVRDGVVEAVASCHNAGIAVNVITGDHPATAAAVARRVGIGGVQGPLVVTGDELALLPERDLDDLLAGGRELVFARSSPEAKLRVTDALHDLGLVTAMTGDGVNDAPALQRADVGVAMGKSGTDVAREAATIVLSDDNFRTIVVAVEEGRRAYAAVRKFIVYIFAHATPEVLPLVLYALSGGHIPLPLTVIQILAIDIGTETLPAIALGRERAEEGAMTRPPRPPHEPLITARMLVRAWLLLGGVSALLVMTGYTWVLLAGGWTWGADTSEGSALHLVALQAATMTFLGIVACQVGVATAARTDRESLWSIGPFSNHLLLWGIAFELVLAVAIVCTPGVHEALGMQLPPWPAVAVLPLFAVAVWGVDELARAWKRQRQR